MARNTLLRQSRDQGRQLVLALLTQAILKLALLPVQLVRCRLLQERSHRLQLFLLLLLVRLLQPVLQVTLIIKYLEITIFHCICRHLGGTPVVFSGGVKNITPLSNVTSIGKVGFIHFVWQYVLLMCVGLGFSAKHCCIPSNVGTCCWNQNWFFSTICYDRNSSW